MSPRALFFVAAVLAALFALSCGEKRPPYHYPVQTFEDQGRDHFQPGQTFDGYNSSPPTSGPHAPIPTPWGVSELPVSKEAAVHNLEHGGVVIWYNCRGGPQPLDDAACQQLRDQLAAITRAAVAAGKLVLMTPYDAGMERRIALTAWRTLDAFDGFDQARVLAFIASYERRFNPEGL